MNGEEMRRAAGPGNSTATVRLEILRLSMAIAAITVALSLAGSLAFSLILFRKSLDGNLLNSARVVAQSPVVVSAMQTDSSSPELLEYLDKSISRVDDIDFIIAADMQGKQLYHPDHDKVGSQYAGSDQQRLLNGAHSFASNDTGIAGAERCAYAAVLDENDKLVGFVVVGVYVKSFSHDIWMIVLRYLLIASVVAALGTLLSTKLSDKITQSLRGYEPDVLASLFQQREDILEALEEGVLAIDKSGKILYINRAAARLLNIDKPTAPGEPLRLIYPASTMERVSRTGKAEYNVNIKSIKNVRILSDRMPLREGSEIVGAVAIFRDRTEMTRMAEDLTGVRHMVEAMRGYTHEFMNKLHVVLGLLELGEYARAEDYILSITNTQHQAVGLIMDRLEVPAVAALLVGKTSRCAELGIRLTLDPESSLSNEEHFLPPDAYITILGNLIDNAIDALGRSAGRSKEITVTVREDDSLLLCVEDNGPGIPKELADRIFQQGVSTKGAGHGTGLALVKDVVDAYGGTIRVESDTDTGGTSFFVTFSAERRREAPPAQTPQ